MRDRARERRASGPPLSPPETARNRPSTVAHRKLALGLATPCPTVALTELAGALRAENVRLPGARLPQLFDTPSQPRSPSTLFAATLLAAQTFCPDTNSVPLGLAHHRVSGVGRVVGGAHPWRSARWTRCRCCTRRGDAHLGGRLVGPVVDGASVEGPALDGPEVAALRAQRVVVPAHATAVTDAAIGKDTFKVPHGGHRQRRRIQRPPAPPPRSRASEPRAAQGRTRIAALGESEGALRVWARSLAQTQGSRRATRAQG